MTEDCLAEHLSALRDGVALPDGVALLDGVTTFRLGGRGLKCGRGVGDGATDVAPPDRTAISSTEATIAAGIESRGDPGGRPNSGWIELGADVSVAEPTTTTVFPVEEPSAPSTSRARLSSVRRTLGDTDTTWVKRTRRKPTVKIDSRKRECMTARNIPGRAYNLFAFHVFLSFVVPLPFGQLFHYGFEGDRVLRFPFVFFRLLTHSIFEVSAVVVVGVNDGRRLQANRTLPRDYAQHSNLAGRCVGIVTLRVRERRATGGDQEEKK